MYASTQFVSLVIKNDNYIIMTTTTNSTKDIKRICGISKNQKINLVNPDSGAPLTSEESVECINDYLINLNKDYIRISNDLQLGGDDFDLTINSRGCIAQKLKENNINKSPGPFDPPTKMI